MAALSQSCLQLSPFLGRSRSPPCKHQSLHTSHTYILGSLLVQTKFVNRVFFILWKFSFQIISLDLWLILNIWKLFSVCNPNFFGFGLWSLRDVALCTKLLFFPPAFIKPAAFIKPPGFMHVAHTWFSDPSSLLQLSLKLPCILNSLFFAEFSESFAISSIFKLFPIAAAPHLPSTHFGQALCGIPCNSQKHLYHPLNVYSEIEQNMSRIPLSWASLLQSHFQSIEYYSCASLVGRSDM